MPDDKPEGNDTVVSKGPCDKCGSKDNFVTYADGHSFCFSPGCGHRVRGDGDLPSSPAQHSPSYAGELLDPSGHSDPFATLNKRRITADTLRRFGVFQHGWNGKMVQVYPYYSAAGELVAQKLRLPDKTFPLLKTEGYKTLAQCQLFGRHVFGERYDRQVVICEGELDAMSVAQATNFKVAAVSINAGAGSAVKVLQENWLWLDRFKDIVLWFDDDEVGRSVIDACADLFRAGSVRVAKVPGFKDASDVLQANRPGDIQTALYSAQTWRKAGMVNAADGVEDVLTPTEGTHAFSYEWPWAELGDFLGPMLPGQVCYHVAGTGIGKSTAVATIALGVVEQGGKVAYMSFEGTRREIKLSLMTIAVGKRLDINPLSDDEMRAIHEQVFGSRHFELFDPETAEWTVEAICGYVRYAAKALECTVVVIDPLSFMAAGISQAADERRALDMVSRDTAAMAKELGIHIQISHHLSRPEGTAHEEGAATSLNQVRGSGGIANFATFVIGHERNQQAPGDEFLITQLRSLKNRPRSRTGPMLTLEYSLETGQLRRSSRPFPSPGNKKREGGFEPVSGDY